MGFHAFLKKESFPKLDPSWNCSAPNKVSSENIDPKKLNLTDGKITVIKKIFDKNLSIPLIVHV